MVLDKSVYWYHHINICIVLPNLCSNNNIALYLHPFLTWLLFKAVIQTICHTHFYHSFSHTQIRIFIKVHKLNYHFLMFVIMTCLQYTIRLPPISYWRSLGLLRSKQNIHYKLFILFVYCLYLLLKSLFTCGLQQTIIMKSHLFT